MLADLGLRTITFQPFRDFEGMPTERRARAFQRAERKFDVMQEIGYDLLMICSNVSPAHLVAIDHISQSMQYQEMLTWLLFYRSLLDVSKLPEQEVLDPGGLVKSQVLQSEDGALRFILNASQSAQTLSSRFLSEAFGSGVQHIAFASADIFATARALEATGVELLPISENYYDDLEAKSDLEPAMLEELKAHNILYEREGDGEYFQLYTRAFANRFFFEIVERRGGYSGFGASNAQVRLAAQARFNPIAAGQ